MTPEKPYSLTSPMEVDPIPRCYSVAFVTMGCAKNEVDSADMALRLKQAGYKIVAQPEEADIVIVNTCSFIQEATEESIDAVLDACGLERVKAGQSGLIVAGCMPARYKEDLTDALPEVRSFVPCADEANIVDRVEELITQLALDVPLLDTTSDSALLYRDAFKQDEPLIQQCEPFAYVKISDGCDRFCSYCTIPFIRGRYHSFPYEQIRSDVARAQASGAQEIVLIAQDTGRWGCDLDRPSSLAKLMDKLASEFSSLWFRVMYIQPEGITDELLDVAFAHTNICSYFDIPFQHVDEALLKSMNRKGNAQAYLELIDRIRTRVPDVTLRTTLMVGFPGETEEQFQELIEFVQEAELDYVGMFAYSREEGTRSDALPGHLDEGLKHARLQELRDVADAVSTSVISRRIGKEFKMLVCGQEEDGQWYGRTQGQAPEVDGLTYFDPEPFTLSCGNAPSVGDIITIRIEDTLFYEMEGSLIDECSN